MFSRKESQISYPKYNVPTTNSMPETKTSNQPCRPPVMIKSIPYSPHRESAQPRIPPEHLAASFKIPKRAANVLLGDPLEGEGTAGFDK